MNSSQDIIRISNSARSASSFTQLGEILMSELSLILPIDRLNIGLIDIGDYSFTDAFVKGQNVPGRALGHQRTLADTVVEAGMQLGEGIIIGDEPPEKLIEHFPRLKSTLDTGIRSMLAAPLETDNKVVAAIVLCSIRTSAYTLEDLKMVRGIGLRIIERAIELKASS